MNRRMAELYIRGLLKEQRIRYCVYDRQAKEFLCVTLYEIKEAVDTYLGERA